MTDLWIIHATIFTPSERLENASVLVSGGLIRSVELHNAPAPAPDAVVMDATGLLLAPGFIDLQINGALGQDFTEEPASIWQVARELPRWGVTSFLPTIITAPFETVDEAMRVVRTGAPEGFRGAAPLGLHLEGPFINPARKGAHNPAYLQKPDPALVKNWTLANGVRLATLAPELPGALETIRALVKQGVVVSAGHSMATFEQAEAGFEAGIRYGTHLFNAMSPLEHRKPNLPGALLSTQGIPVGLIADGIHTHPAIVRLVWQAKGSQELTLVTDAMAALGMQPGRYVLGDYDVQVDEHSARLSDGTLAGSILSSEAAVRNLMAFTGCTLAEALPTVTSTPARVLRLADRGAVQPGYVADLVLLAPDATVMATIARGEVLFTRIHTG